MANGGRLVVEHAQPEVRAFGAEIVEHGGEVGELGAGCGLSHGMTPPVKV